MKLSAIPPGGVSSVFATNSNWLYASTGLAVDNADNVYVANEGSTIINKFKPSGVGTVFATTNFSAEGLAFDNVGNLYVANFSDNRIVKFTSQGVSSVFADKNLSGPMGLAFDKNGNLYAANFVGNTIEKFSPAGANLGVFASTGLNHPFGIAFDSAGYLYAANFYGNTIEKFSPDGADLGVFASTGLKGPSYITIVPEPTVVPDSSLHIVASGNQISLSWPVSASEYILQVATNLSSPLWIDLTVSPVIQDLQCVLTNKLTSGSQFYRLRSP